MIVGNKWDAAKKKNKKHKVNKFNFVIFTNYDGSTTGKIIARETYNQIFKESE